MESPPVKSTKLPTKPKPLSRLKEERGKDPCYLSQYYFEHKDNFGIFFMILLEGSTVTKLVSNAKDIALRFVRQLHLAPDDYTDEVIARAYDTLNEAFSTKGEPIKTLMLNGMTSYFEVIKEINKESGTLEEARTFFTDSSAQSKLQVFSNELLGKKHDANKAAKFFYPQLCLFFERFFEIYDSAIKGAPAMEVIKQIEKQQQQEKLNQIKNDPNTLKNVWKETSQKNTPMGPTEPFKYDRNADLEPSNPQIEEELDALAEHYTNGRLDFQALWNYRGDDFEEKWKNSEETKRKEYIHISRSYVAGRAEMGIAFCPELNDELAAGDLLLKFMKDCAKFTEDISQLDSFTSKLHLQMKSKGMESKKSLLTIIYSRRWTLCAFAVNLMFEVLELGKENQQESESRVEEIKEESEKVPTIQNLANEAMTKSVAKDKPLPAVVEKANPLEKPLARKCSASGCLNREVEGTKFNVCGSCKKVGIIVPYCSKDCQLKDWKEGHKAKCGSK